MKDRHNLSFSSYILTTIRPCYFTGPSPQKTTRPPTAIPPHPSSPHPSPPPHPSPISNASSQHKAKGDICAKCQKPSIQLESALPSGPTSRPVSSRPVTSPSAANRPIRCIACALKRRGAASSSSAIFGPAELPKAKLKRHHPGPMVRSVSHDYLGENLSSMA